MPFERLSGRHEVSWIYTAVEQRPLMLCGDKGNCIVGHVGAAGEEDEAEVAVDERMFDEGDSVDGGRYREALPDETLNSADGLSGRPWDLGDEVDDTFLFRRGVAS